MRASEEIGGLTPERSADDRVKGGIRKLNRGDVHLDHRLFGGDVGSQIIDGHSGVADRLQPTVVDGFDASAFNDQLVLTSKKAAWTSNVVGYLNRHFIEERSDRLVHGTTVRAIEQGVARGRTGIVFGFQSPDALHGNIDAVADFQVRALRVCGLAYNVGDEMDSGCVDPDPGRLRAQPNHTSNPA